MKFRTLGISDIAVSEISLGCWTMGGLNYVNGQANGWASVDEEQIVEAVRMAVDAGVNHFDNADVYGNGEAERMLARVFERLGLDSQQFIIATKVGHNPGTAAHGYEPQHIRHQCEQSLINLKRDYIDLYYLHHGNFGPNNQYLEPAAQVLNELQTEGKIRLKGQSAYSEAHFALAVPVVKPSVLQSWSNATDIRFIHPDSVVSSLLAEYQMSFVAFSPLKQGLLLDKFDPDNPPQFDEGDHRRGKPQFERESLLDFRQRLIQIKERFGATTEDLASVAMRFILDQPHVGCVIPGFRNSAQVACNLAAQDRSLSEEDRVFIAEVMGTQISS